jgi:hypothetical protein
VKTALKGKRFQDTEDIKENVTAELNAPPLEAFADCFQKFLNYSANVFNWAEVASNRNKIIFDFLFYFVFHTSPGTLLSCHEGI